MLRKFVVALALLAAAPALAQDNSRNATAAAELRTLCEADRSRLWGADLCGPLIVVDPRSRAVWASQADTGGVLQPGDGGFVGTLPQGVTVANTSVEWSGVRWIMVMGPLPEDATARRVLLAHEAWHRIQEGIGLAAEGGDNLHLESERGRTLLRLEIRALRRALDSRGSARWASARDALLFRFNRTLGVAGANDQENALDRNEGLAAYTGVRLGAGNNAQAFAIATLTAYENRESYARSYAYATGPAYGLLLDERRRNWRGELGAEKTAADLLADELRDLNSATRLAEAMVTHGASAIAAEEATRARTRRTRDAAYRARFTGLRLELPLTAMQMELDPNRVVPVEGLGTVYGTLTLRDAWGELRATEDALISSDFTRLTAAQPAAGGLSGPGWTLRLNPGFQVSAPDAQGVSRVIAQP